MIKRKSYFAVLTAAVILFSAILSFATCFHHLSAEAIFADHPAQLVRICTYDNTRELNISGTADRSFIEAVPCSSSKDASWRFDYAGSDDTGNYFRIVNAVSGRPVTPVGYNTKEGSGCFIFGYSENISQCWYVIPTDKDKYGNGYHYKIVNCNDPSMALTFDPTNNSVKLTAFRWSSYQQWLINTAGLQGFAGYAKDKNGEKKASDIGGLLGEKVEVTDFSELKAACESSGTKTIVITENISGLSDINDYIRVTDLNRAVRYVCPDDRIKICGDKTIIGSYSAHRLNNIFFRTDEKSGGNIIISNIQVTHDSELNCDDIWEFTNSRNVWIDHCDFTGHDKLGVSSLGSFGKDNFFDISGASLFATISDCKFTVHENGIIIGTAKDSQETYDSCYGKPNVTIAYNYFRGCRDHPLGCLRYGNFHTLNNLVNEFDRAAVALTASTLYSENNYLDGGYGEAKAIYDQPVACNIIEDYIARYRDSGSALINSSYGTKPLYAVDCEWEPATSYVYTARPTLEAKVYCIENSGAVSTRFDMRYSVFSEAGMPSADNLSFPEADMDDEAAYISGDVNMDGRVGTADLTVMEKWLLGGNVRINSTAADICSDNTVDVYDLVMLRKLVAEGTHRYEPADFEFSGKVYIVGDSTASDYLYNDETLYNRYGWGTLFEKHFNDVTVINLALSGRSSRSFSRENNYKILTESLSEGDYLFIQFGHNDQKHDESRYPKLGTYSGLDMNTLDSEGKNEEGRYSFEWMILNKYVDLARSKGAMPVLLTPITRRAADGTANCDVLIDYQVAMLNVAEQNGLPCIDMTKLTSELYNNLCAYGGPEATAALHCYDNSEHTATDNTHLSLEGADKISTIIANETKRLGLLLGEYLK